MYLVDDFEKTVKELTDKGVEVLLKANFPGGRSIAYVDLGAANIVIELGQKPKA